MQCKIIMYVHIVTKIPNTNEGENEMAIAKTRVSNILSLEHASYPAPSIGYTYKSAKATLATDKPNLEAITSV